MTSLVDAPRLVSSDASRTRIECAVTGGLDAAGARRIHEPQSYHLRRQRRDPVRRLGTRGSGQRAEGAGNAVLDEPHVVHLALLVRRAAAHGGEDPVADGRVRDVGQRGALTWLRRIPGIRQQPRRSQLRTRPRSRATWSDSTPRPRRRGRWQVGSTAAKSETPKGRACLRRLAKIK